MNLDLRHQFHHYDPSQLAFQLQEVFTERTYLQHGIEVQRGDVVFDVGANVGVASVFFALECGAGAVHSFEPVGPIYDLLCQNLSGLPNCIPHDYGLAGEARRASITYYPGAAAMSGIYADPATDRAVVRTALLNAGMSDDRAAQELAGRYRPQKLTCDLRTLSDVFRELSVEGVDLLKIDVEKAEMDVLDGIREHDWPRIRQLVVEVHDERGRLASISRGLRRRGFSVTSRQDPVMRGTSIHVLYALRA